MYYNFGQQILQDKFNIRGLNLDIQTILSVSNKVMKTGPGSGLITQYFGCILDLGDQTETSSRSEAMKIEPDPTKIPRLPGSRTF